MSIEEQLEGRCEIIILACLDLVLEFMGFRFFYFFFLCSFSFFFFKQKTAYEIYQCDWSSDVCSSDLYLPNSILC